ncbi:DNA-binding transcriptional MerR regulator/effector-binding domain-containing protein [Clostridium algifaecis]|uniref:DNA-binding transcriptional MerR regulator/effector-binding domain-containing protein n=2 Tax=Clostridium algifaecis TaxID=1472040 RepID=A0ABS4KVA4_9CLOT|nr:DNA-binding transcriptional MerR regulator/effector-binding domain-containing protein [Clostridium algifaecis]
MIQMVRIGDFSKIARVSIRMLRHYDQIGIFKPACIDNLTGYRGYSIEQLPKLNRIIFLKDIGFSLNEVKELIDENISIDEMKEMLLKRQKDLENEISMAQINLKTVMDRLKTIEDERNIPRYDISIKRTDSYTLASHRTIVPHMNQMGIFCYDMYSKLYKELNKMNITPIGPEITFYYNEEYCEADLDMETGILVPHTWLDIKNKNESILMFRNIEAEENMAFLLYSGSFDGIEQAIIELLKWVAVNNWQITGALRELHLSGPAHPDGKVVENAIVELQIPVSKIL